MGRSVKSKLSLQIFYRFVVTSLQVMTISSFIVRAAAQPPAPTPTAALASSPVPVITIDPKSFDFGRIQFGQTVIHRFKVSNTGQATLHIKAVHANCGCTSTLIGKLDLEPGESTEIEATFKPESSSGAVSKAILVFSDDPAHPRLTLRFKADVLPPPSSDRPTVSFHDVDRTSLVHGSVRLPVTTVNEIRLGDATYLSVYPKPDGDGTILDIVLDGSRLPKEAMSGQNILTVISTGNVTVPVLISWDLNADSHKGTQGSQR
jgi:hypothetical protein